MLNNYPEYILQMLRQRKGLGEDDARLDNELNNMSKDIAFRQILNWNGLLGRWDIDIKDWIKGIYEIDLNEIN